MAKKRIIILGAGLAGLSAARYLQEKGRDAVVFEKEAQPGGLCRSKNINGFTFDFCGHLLHFRRKESIGLVNRFFPQEELLFHDRSAWVYSHKVFTKYPFQANLFGLPRDVVRDCLLGLIEASGNGRLKKNKKINFAEWIHLRFGSGIARHFMEPYNNKFWTIPCHRLTCDWLKDIVPVPTMRQTLEGTLEESSNKIGYNTVFWYPKKNGIGEFTHALAAKVKNIYTCAEAKSIDLRRKKIKFSSGDTEKFDQLVYAIPLPEMLRLGLGLPQEMRGVFGRLNWNSIFNLNLGIDIKEGSTKHWVYFPEEDISFFRAGFFHNFSPALSPEGKSSLYIEVAYSKERPIDKNKIIECVMCDLKRSGLLREENAILAQDINDIKYGYPIYDANYGHARAKIIKYLSGKDIFVCGRYGSWRYMSMEDAILDGKRLAKIL